MKIFLLRFQHLVERVGPKTRLESSFVAFEGTGGIFRDISKLQILTHRSSKLDQMYQKWTHNRAFDSSRGQTRGNGSQRRDRLQRYTLRFWNPFESGRMRKNRRRHVPSRWRSGGIARHVDRSTLQSYQIYHARVYAGHIFARKSITRIARACPPRGISKTQVA